MNIRLFAAAMGGLAIASTSAAAPLKTAVFAGGCFWSVEHELEKAPGVSNVVVGYAGGARPRPTYANHTGHLEAVKVTYDPAKTSYAALTDYFFRHIDPTDANGQVCDQGPSYRTAVFVGDEAERTAAERVKGKVAQTLGRPVATRILPAGRFWMGEAYHQDYARNNPVSYARYRIGCGRDAKIKAVWKGR